jgi:hypothetical protein
MASVGPIDHAGTVKAYGGFVGKRRTAEKIASADERGTVQVRVGTATMP